MRRTEQTRAEKNGGVSSTQLELLLLHEQVIDSIEFLENKPLLDKVFLHKKYVEEGLSTAQIAHEIDFSKNAVRSALMKAGIPLREKSINHGIHQRSYGFRKVNGKRVPHLAEQRVINSIIEFREKEQLSFHKIAKYLNQMGVPTKTNTRQGWVRETVRNMYRIWSKKRQIE